MKFDMKYSIFHSCKMHFIFIIFLKHFIIWPYYITPNHNDVFHRYICKGFACHENDYPNHQITEFNDLITKYENYELDENDLNLENQISQLIKRGFYPGYCCAGLFEMLGMAGFKQNISGSYEKLMMGSSYKLWSCNEVLSYHPLTKDPLSYVRLAASQGGIRSMLRLALETKNQTESLELLKYLATIQSSKWWKMRRSGIEYSDALSTILKLNNRNITEAWKIIDNMSDEGHLPAALWAAEGLTTGEIGRKNITEAIQKLLPIVITGQWQINIAKVIDSDDSFDKKMVYKMSSLLGNPHADSILSFSKLFE